MSTRETERRERQSKDDRARNASMTLAEWCEHRRISRAMFYVLEKRRKAPRTYNVGSKRLISAEADDEWLRAREAESAETVA